MTQLQSPPPLSREERETWQALKKLSTVIVSLMAGEVVPGVSGADYSVLSRLEELGGEELTLGQSVLLKSLGWDRSRLSHQLTRMEARSLVARSHAGRTATVSLLPAGKEAIAQARPGHAAIIRQLLEQLAADEAAAIKALAKRL